MDRNYIIKITDSRPAASLSARRAWIEIAEVGGGNQTIIVALRKESVDRNLIWHCMSEDVSVALRKESVDRNQMFACVGFH